MVLSPRALWLLRTLAAFPCDADEDFEIDLVVEGKTVWLGAQRMRWATIEQCLRCLALSEDSDGGLVRRYAINATGRAIARRPELAGEVFAAVHAGRPFTVRDDRIVEMSQ